MFEGIFQLVHKFADKEIKTLIPIGTEVPVLKEALFNFLGFVVQYEKEQVAAQQAAAQKAAEQPPVSE
jgi:hypothetical protein